MYPSMPQLLPNSEFRHFRLRLLSRTEGIEDKWIKILKPIRTSKDLKKWLDLWNPTDVYQTISLWVNPQYLGTKKHMAGYPILQSQFITSDYLMDFDSKDYSSEDEMQINIARAFYELKQLGMIKYTYLRTGNGFQIIIHDFKDYANIDIPDLRNREYAYLAKMKKLTKFIESKGIKWDSDVSVDTRRICRVPNTIHNNGRTIELIRQVI